MEVVVPPVAASAYWGLQSAGAFVATRLGTTLRHILQQHSMWHMAQARPCSDPLSPGPAPILQRHGSHVLCSLRSPACVPLHAHSASAVCLYDVFLFLRVCEVCRQPFVLVKVCIKNACGALRHSTQRLFV